ncbi:MAG: hypothetical protein A4S09_00670 [Proteobacteria bacterium SG_bin7]|nr:MAG: hypothetical protein A4S09_00670 [Proteobacteria bacterium SG_bin7]
MTARILTRLIFVLLGVSLSLVSESFAESKKKAKTKSQSQSKHSKPKTEKKNSTRDELLDIGPEDGGDIAKESAPPVGFPPPDHIYTNMAAVDDSPYYYWQVNKGVFAITPYAEGTYFKYKGTYLNGAPGGLPYDVKGQKYRGGIEVEYGILKYLSVGVGASYYAQYTDEDVSTANGFEDIPVFAKAFYPLKNFIFHYGIRMTFSPSDKISDGFGNRNSFSGGNTYGPYFGISRKLESGVAGANVSYAYKDTRSTFRDPTTGNPVSNRVNIEGGHVLNIFGFYERRMGSWTLGGAIGYSGESNRSYKSSVATSFEDGETNFVGKVYFPYKSGTMDIMPSIQGQTFLDDQLGNRLLDAKWQVTARCDVRF